MHPNSIRDARRDIIEQHDELRARLQGLMLSADRADAPWGLVALQLLVLRFTADFEKHLAYEDRELGPRLHALDAWGEVRKNGLLAEHRAQRRRLVHVCALAETSCDSADLAEAVWSLCDDLLDDMAEEERALAELVAIEELGQLEQMTG